MNFLRKAVPVLMYHRINQSDLTSSLVVSPQSFARQIDWLEKESFHLLSLDEVLDRKGKIPLWERSVSLTFDDGFRDNYENAFSVLISRKKKAALFVVVDWVGRNGFLNWKEIQELSDAGITIGSHSQSHRWLPDLTDQKELEKEIGDSKKEIEERIGKPVRHFSYPVGGVDQRVSEGVRKAGYRAAWVAGARPSLEINEPHLALRRIKVTPSDSYLFRYAVKAYGIRGLFW